jgi:uncharacterized membrane protein
MFEINYLELFKGLPPQLAVSLIALVPITEIRASIPAAIFLYKLPVWQAVFFSVLPDIILVALVMYLIGPTYNFLTRHFPRLDNIFQWIFRRTRRKLFHKYEIWGNLALMLFVAVPLPFTGVWTAAVGSWLFGIPPKWALFYISLGAIISAGVITLTTLTVARII